MPVRSNPEPIPKNNDYFGNRTLEQDPVYSTQAHGTYSFGGGVWAALSGTYDYGGRTRIDGVEVPDFENNWRVGVTLALPVNRNNSIKFNASTGVYTATGSDFDLFGIFWQYRWGQGLLHPPSILGVQSASGHQAIRGSLIQLRANVKFSSDAPFDLITLHQNIYYFPVDKRVPLFRHLIGHLNRGGKLLLTSIGQGGGPGFQALNIWCSTTEGCGPLPYPDQLCDQLQKAGFGKVKKKRLIPFESFWGFVATKTA
ncbi:MAG: hypothetical protein ABIL58_04040 [Pseudomonadota bacterium]